MIYDSSIDTELLDYLKILDRDGNVVWEDGYR